MISFNAAQFESFKVQREEARTLGVNPWFYSRDEGAFKAPTVYEMSGQYSDYLIEYLEGEFIKAKPVPRHPDNEGIEP